MAKKTRAPRKRASTARPDPPDDAPAVEVIVKVREANYVPAGVTVRAQISPQLFTSVVQGSTLKKLEQDAGVRSVSVSQTLRTQRD